MFCIRIVNSPLLCEILEINNTIQKVKFVVFQQILIIKNNHLNQFSKGTLITVTLTNSIRTTLTHLHSNTQTHSFTHTHTYTHTHPQHTQTHEQRQTYPDTHKHTYIHLKNLICAVVSNDRHTQTTIHKNTYSALLRISLTNTSTHKHKNNYTNKSKEN